MEVAIATTSYPQLVGCPVRVPLGRCPGWVQLALKRCRLIVRITPESGHVADIPDRQLRARSRPCCSFTGRLNSNNRCVHVIQGLRANVSEAHVAHPLPALRSGVLKASRGLDQHVEARQQRVSLDATPIVDERIVHDERTPPGSA
jgi:hypothetical protein